MNKKEKITGNLSIRIDKKLLNQYKSICDKNGFDMSKRLRKFIETEIIYDNFELNLFSKIELNNDTKKI